MRRRIADMTAEDHIIKKGEMNYDTTFSRTKISC